jgi:hypothetical protein
MLNNAIITGVIVGIITGIIILILEYGFFDNDKPTVIVLSKDYEISNQFQPEDEKEMIESSIMLPLDFKINYLYRPVGDEDFKLLKTDTVLKSHDHYKIIFTPLEESYVYLFQMDSAGKIYQLFPMKRFKDIVLNNTNPVQANTTYYIPGKDKSFALDERTGTETIYFIATRQPDVELEQQYQKLQLAQHQDNAIQLKLAEADFIKILHQRKPTEITDDTQMFNWTEQEQTFMVVQQQLIGLCQNCVQTLTFKHQ